MTDSQVIHVSISCVKCLFSQQRLQKAKLCADVGLLDEKLLRRAFMFMSSVAQLLLRIVETDGG